MLLEIVIFTTENESANEPNHSRYYSAINDEHDTGVNH